MSIKTLTKYKTTDGTLFDSEKEALIYQNKIDQYKNLDSLLKAYKEFFEKSDNEIIVGIRKNSFKNNSSENKRVLIEFFGDNSKSLFEIFNKYYPVEK
jgi:hypothetical protein